MSAPVMCGGCHARIARVCLGTARPLCLTCADPYACACGVSLDPTEHAEHHGRCHVCRVPPAFATAGRTAVQS